MLLSTNTLNKTNKYRSGLLSILVPYGQSPTSWTAEGVTCVYQGCPNRSAGTQWRTIRPFIPSHAMYLFCLVRNAITKKPTPTVNK